MVRKGYAFNYDYYSKEFKSQEDLARKEELGIWKHKCQNPYNYRKKTKKSGFKNDF